MRNHTSNSCFICLLIMDSSSQRSSPLRKTSYFEKYRKELQRISEEMRSKNQSNSFSDKSESKNPSKVLSHSEHRIITPTLAPTTNLTFTLTPLKSSFKKNPIFQAQREPARPVEPKQIRQTRDQVEQGPRENEEAMKEVDLLVGELEVARAKLARYEEEITVKRNALQSLRRELARQSPLSAHSQLQNYAQKMLAIETRMKFKKELHEDELNRLVNERNQRHSENVELSKLIECLEEQLQTLIADERRSEQPTASLQMQTNKLHAEIVSLAQECADVEMKINNTQELREISTKEYKRFSEVYRRQLLGKQVAQAEQRIRESNNEKRYLVEIERKKMLIKQRKVQNSVRQRALVELVRIINFGEKQIKNLEKELKAITSTDKSVFFKQVK